MNIKELLKTTPQNLSEQQLAAVVEFTVERLRKIATHIKKHEIEAVGEMLAGSPAGDGHGCDNRYIDFSDMFPEESRNGHDLSDVLDLMEKLIKASKG